MAGESVPLQGSGISRMYAPTAATNSNQAVTSGAVITFTTVLGHSYVVSATVEVTFLEGTNPTTTTGMIIPTGGMVGPITSATGGTFRFIATSASGRVSVVEVYPRVT